MAEHLSHYELLDKLGVGGMGTVWRARDRRDGSIVAVKVLHPHLAADDQYVRRFQREVRIAQGIDSPHVVKVLDSGADGDSYFLVMEYVAGETLAQLVQKRGRLPIDEAVGIARDVARGLAAAHARGVVHRDVSPQNVIITGIGAVKLTDFGVARDLAATAMTATSMLLGKPEYIAPEVVTGRVKPDIRADIYALGVVLYQMLAGSVPFHADTPYAVLMKQIGEKPPRVISMRPETPPWLESVVLRCIAKDPGDRFATPELLADALDRQLAMHFRPAAEANRRRRLVAAGGIAGLAAVVAVVALVLMRTDNVSTAPAGLRTAAEPQLDAAPTVEPSQASQPAAVVPVSDAAPAPAPEPPQAAQPAVVAPASPPPPSAPAPPVAPIARPAVAIAPALVFDGRQEPGSLGCCAPADYIPYRFILQGATLPGTADDLRARLFSTPPLPNGSGIRPPNHIVVYIPPSTPSEVYHLTFRLASGESVQADLVHVQAPQPPLVIRFDAKLRNDDPAATCNNSSNYRFYVPGLKNLGSIGDGSGYATAASGLTVNGQPLGSGDLRCWRRMPDDSIIIGLSPQAARGVRILAIHVIDGRKASVSFEHVP